MSPDQQRMAILAIVLGTAVAPPRSHAPWILYNGSGSAPLGWYQIEHRLPRQGDAAVIRPSQTIASLLAAYAVLPPGIPLLKRVAAVGGDRICRSQGVVSINGAASAEALTHDQSGRLLPIWEGCSTLLEGQFFVIQPHPYSFDSRYFGPVSECHIIGVAKPLWTWNPDP
jgi:conjugative transfer signal peptidase TraF